MAKEPTFLTVKYLSGCEHRQALGQSRQIFHVAPWVPLRQNMLVARSDWGIFELKIFFMGFLKVMGELWKHPGFWDPSFGIGLLLKYFWLFHKTRKNCEEKRKIKNLTWNGTGPGSWHWNLLKLKPKIFLISFPIPPMTDGRADWIDGPHLPRMGFLLSAESPLLMLRKKKEERNKKWSTNPPLECE